MSGRSEDELLQIIGSRRAEYSPMEVAAAEGELRDRAASSRTDALGRLRTATRIALLVGGVCAFVPFALLQEPMHPGRPDPLALQIGPWIQAVLGVVVGIGGIGLWKRRAWGARLIVTVLRVVMLLTVGFHIYFVGDIAQTATPLLAGFFVIVGVLFTLLYLAMLQRGVIYLSEPGLASLLDDRPKQHAG